MQWDTLGRQGWYTKLTNIIDLHSWMYKPILIILPPIHVYPSLMTTHSVAITTARNGSPGVWHNVEELLFKWRYHLFPISAVYI